MTRLMNFTLGAMLAATLIVPAAWSDARHPVHIDSPLAAAMNTPLPHLNVLAAVRSVFVRTP